MGKGRARPVTDGEGDSPADSGSGDERFLDPAPRIASTARLKGCKVGRYAEVGERVILRDVTVGDFTYFERQGEAIHADIGRFCSIAANVRINALAHPVERALSHKITYRPNEYFRWKKLDSDWRKKRANQRVLIGHDVWIGHGAVILPGVSIGNGAVIGANAVVTGDVAPYMIVAGAPARPIRSRFPQPIAERLQALAVWDWPLEVLYEAIDDMQRLDIEAFLERWESLARLIGLQRTSKNSTRTFAAKRAPVPTRIIRFSQS